ncbi:MAG: FAD-binding oxidoreductase [Terriglobia bacterium]
MPVSLDKFQQVEIISRTDYSPDLWSVRVRLEEKLVFKPGQYATLAVECGSTLIQRAYSIVSSPLEEDLEFFFELVPQGELTPRLFELRAGRRMWMRRQARGLFTLDGKSGHANHFFLCTVTGVAPFVSMIRSLAIEGRSAAARGLKIALIQAASRSWEFAYREELDDFAKTIEGFYYIPSVSRPWEDPEWKCEVGRAEDVARKYLDSFCFEPASTTAYLCGHPQMIENCKGILKRRGFEKQSVREEIYWIPAKQPAPPVAS